MLLVYGHSKGVMMVLAAFVCCLIMGFSARISLVQAQAVVSAPLIQGGVGGQPLSVIVPNDPLWGQQWYLRQVRADEAWTVTTGTSEVIVAIIDVGVDITHPDLRDVIWRNPLEREGDGIDNDHNGFIDDIHGWNFVDQSPEVKPLRPSVPSEEAWSHGTMVASLIGAKGNDGIGMAGVAWNVRLMPLVALDRNGSGSTQDIVRAIRYALAMKANVINLSLSGSEQDPALTEMIERAVEANVVVVGAIGNSDERKEGVNLDESPRYPACGERGQDTILGVGGTDAFDRKARYANFGKVCTDISAPAADLLAARPSYPPDPADASPHTDAYRKRVGGTSLASPLVAGAVALLKSLHPEWTVQQLQAHLYATADHLDLGQPPGEKTVLGYGRLNIGRAVREGASPIMVVSGGVTSSRASIPAPLLRQKAHPIKIPVKVLSALQMLVHRLK